MSDEELKKVQAVATAMSDAYENGVNDGLEFGKTERERLRADLAAARALIKELWHDELPADMLARIDAALTKDEGRI